MKEFEGKRLLLLGGIKVACEIVRKAQEMGAYVIVADYNTDSPAKEIADEALLLDATDVSAIVSWCKNNKVDGVTTGFVDILMPICYEVCKQLGLPYYATPKMLSMATNKNDFKETCQKFDIKVPRTYYIGNKIPDSVFASLNYPIFVKPMDASGSRGAGVCRNREELEARFEDALSYSASKNVVVEDYMQGTEFLLDYVGVNGEWRLLSMFDRYMSKDRASAVNYSNVCIAPSKVIDTYYSEINPKIQKMFNELGFKDGLIFLQGHSDGNKITFYEMGCRLGGSFSKLEQAVIGLNPVEMTIRYALSGKMVNDIKQISLKSAKFNKTAMVCNYLLKGDDETVASIEGIEEVEKLNTLVSVVKHRDVGCHFYKDRTIDKPILTFYMDTENLNNAKQTLEYLNQVIQVKNNERVSLLSEKFDPNDLPL